MSFTNSVAGGFPVTGGSAGSPAAGGLGAIFAHFAGAAAAEEVAEALDVGEGVLSGVAAFFFPLPLDSAIASQATPPTTRIEAIVTPMIALRLRRLARSCCSRSRRRS